MAGKGLFARLVDPAPAFVTRSAQRAPRLLAGTVLILSASFVALEIYFVVEVSNYRPPWPAYVALAVIYALSRTRHYRTGGVMLAGLFPAVSMGQVALGVAADPAVTLCYSALSPLVGALFLPLSWVPGVGLANLAALAAVGLASPAAPSASVLVACGLAIFLATVLSFLHAHSREQAEAERQRTLKEEEERLRFALEAARLGHWELRLDSGVSRISDRTAEILGMAPGDWRGDREAVARVVHPDDRELVARELSKAARGEPNEPKRHRIVRPDGSVRWVEVHARVLDQDLGRVVGTLEDVTEKREVEERLRQSQKLEAVGRLAGGVAHDFNNLLTVVLGNVDLMRSAPADEVEEQDRVLEEIERAANSARELTSRLLAFSRQSELTLDVIDIGSAVEGALQLARRVIGANVELSLELAPDLWRVRADASQVQHVLLNLANNARDAMPEGGRLSVKVENDPAREGRVPSADGVRVVVGDTGIGMSVSDRERAFEPFFTTKPESGGTGLGLAMVRSAMMQAGGSVELESEVDVGTTVTLWFARARGADARNAPSEREGSAAGQRVLLVEDESSVRSLCERMLQRGGYGVLSASSAEQALDIWARDGDQVAALLSDVVMGGMSGVELAARLRREAPELPVLLMSGYAPDVAVPLSAEHRDFIAKPFGAEELLARLGALLDPGPEARAQARVEASPP